MVSLYPSPLQVVLERLGCGDPARGVLFFWDEVSGWPSGTLDILVNGGVLRQAQPIATIECDGCEENCVMPVTVYPAQEDKPGRAFINCDKREEIGRIHVDFRRMEQWQSSGELVAATLVQILDFIEPAKAIDGKRWHLGVLKGNANNKSLVVLLTEGGLELSLAGHTIALSEVLTVKKNALVLDKAKLVRLVNEPVGNTETKEERAERLKARLREEKTKGTKNFLQFVATEEGISVSRVKQLTATEKTPVSPFAALMFPTRSSSKKIKPKQ